MFLITLYFLVVSCKFEIGKDDYKSESLMCSSDIEKFEILELARDSTIWHLERCASSARASGVRPIWQLKREKALASETGVRPFWCL